MKNPFVVYKEQISTMLKLAYPIVLGQLSVVLMGVADTVMVGDLGDDFLASANQANNIFFMACGLTFGVLFAISTLVSIKVGQGKASDGFITYRAGLVIAVILFIAQFSVMQLLVHNFHWLNQKGRDGIKRSRLCYLGFSHTYGIIGALVYSVFSANA